MRVNGATCFARTPSVASYILAIVVVALAGCDIPALSGLTAGEDSKTGFNIDFADALNRRLSALVDETDASRTENCLRSSRNDPSCVLVRTPDDLPACPFARRIEACVAIELRAALLTRTDVAQVVERETATYCSYAVDRDDPRRPGVVQVIGCERPSPEHELFYQGHPTLCVVLIGEHNERTEVFAVKDGRRVQHRWCDRFRA